MATKFKEGDVVRILENRLYPKSVNKIGIITKVYEDAETGEPLYRVRLAENKHNLRGVSEESYLEAVERYKMYHPASHVNR